MTLRSDLFLAKVLNTELKYQFLKNTPRFQKNDKQSVTHAKRYLTNNVRSSLYVNTFIYGIISVSFGIGSISTKSGMSSDSFILFLLLLILAIMSDTQFYRGVWDMKLLTPLKQLPLKVERRVVPISLFFVQRVLPPLRYYSCGDNHFCGDQESTSYSHIHNVHGPIHLLCKAYLTPCWSHICQDEHQQEN